MRFIATFLKKQTVILGLLLLFAHSYGIVFSQACGQDTNLAASLTQDQLLEALSPNNSNEFSNRGLVRWRAGDLKGALEDFEKAIQLDAVNVEAYSGRGYVRIHGGEVRGALSDFDKAISLDPRCALAYCGRGQAQAELGDEKKALLDFSQAIKLDSNNAEAYIFRGYHLGRRGEKKKAIADFDETIRLDPDNALAYCYRGTSREAVKDRKGAIEDFDQVIKFDPEYAWAYYRRGQNRDALADRKGAIADFNQYIRLLPKDPWGFRARGFTLHEMGKRRQAIADYVRAIALDPDDAWTFSARGYEKGKIGDTRGAIKDYREAARLEKRKAIANKKKTHPLATEEIRLITDSEIYNYCARTFTAAKNTFGEPRVPIKQLLLFHRPGPGCQTVLMDKDKGIFCIFLANKEADDCFIGNLGHEICHLLNARLCDPYIEGLCSLFGEHAITDDEPRSKERRDAFRALLALYPFYAETYFMMKEIESRIGIYKLKNILDFVEDDSSHHFMHIDIDKWLASLPEPDRATVTGIIKKYAESIELNMPKDGNYVFLRPSEAKDKDG